MAAYRSTFRKHRILFCLPALLLAAALGFLSFSAPVKYQSSANLWTDNGPLGQSSLTSGGNAPSSSEQTLLNELLATRDFDLEVGNASSLKKYFQAQGLSKGPLSRNVAATVEGGVTTSVPGPQILTLTFTGPTPETAQSALQSLITQLQGAMTYYGQSFGQTAQSYFQGQVKSESRAVTRTTAAVNAYKQTHPNATPNSDQSYSSLIAAQQSASTQLANATQQLNQATTQANGAGLSTEVRVVDAPSLPSSPTTGKKAVVTKAGGGFLAGLLLSIIVIVAMTPSREDRWEAEISGDEQRGGVAPLSPGVHANGSVHANGMGESVRLHTDGPGAERQGEAHAVERLLRPAPPPRAWASKRRIVVPLEATASDNGGTPPSSEQVSSEVGNESTASRIVGAAFRRGAGS